MFFFCSTRHKEVAIYFFFHQRDIQIYICIYSSTRHAEIDQPHILLCGFSRDEKKMRQRKKERKKRRKERGGEKREGEGGTKNDRFRV